MLKKSNSYPIGPYYAEYGRPNYIPGWPGEPGVTIPVAKLGWAPLPPAEWAAYLKEHAFWVSLGTRGPNEIITLYNAPSRNEPLLRHGKPISGLMLKCKISNKAYNVESALIQVVGTIEPEPCERCGRGNGPWAKCISFHDDENSITSCGNCQWNKNGARCDLPRCRAE